MNLDIGSAVLSSDSHRVGKVDRIIYQPETMVVREFVIHKGLFFATDRIVARALVDSIDDEHVVRLRITVDEAGDLPPFVTDQHIPVFRVSSIGGGEVSIRTSPGSVPRDAVVLSHRSEVYDSADKHLGHLDEVVYEENGVATAFVVDAGRIFHHDVRVPLSAVRSITHDRLELSITADDAEAANKA